MNEEWVTIQEAFERLGIKRNKISRLASRGVIKSKANPLDARVRLVDLNELRALFKQREFCLSQTDQAARRACSSRCRPGFLYLLAVSNEPGDQMNHKIDGAAMASMLDLRNMLELIDNGLDHRPFTQQQFIRKVHEMILHVFAQPGDEMEPLFKEQLREGSSNVAAIPKQLPAQSFHHARNRSPIIDVAGSQATRKPLAAIIDSQVQFKPKEPAHARLPTPGINRKDAVPTDPFGVTDAASKSSR